jgi:hypothetical protein
VEGYDGITVDSAPPPSVSLTGYLVRERDGQLWIQDQLGMWIVNASDIVGREDWHGVADSRYSGEPGVFYIQGDAEIFEVVPIKLKAVESAPFAMLTSARVSSVKGMSELDALVLERSFDEMLEADGSDLATYTYCKGPDGRKYICDNH